MTTQPVLSSSVVMMKMMNNNLHHNDYIILYQLTLTLKMNTARLSKHQSLSTTTVLFRTTFTRTQTQPTFEMTPRFKPFTLYHTIKYTCM